MEIKKWLELSSCESLAENEAAANFNDDTV